MVGKVKSALETAAGWQVCVWRVRCFPILLLGTSTEGHKAQLLSWLGHYALKLDCGQWRSSKSRKWVKVPDKKKVKTNFDLRISSGLCLKTCHLHVKPP
jgi:hypothetical protein